MITLNNFICKQCGKCCLTYTIKLSDEDMERIGKLGYRYFAEPDNFDPKTGRFSLKRENDQCIFLVKRGDKYSCKIYPERPSICRKYPFNEVDKVESCEPSS